MRQQLRRHVEPFVSPILDGVAETCSIPVDDDCCEQIQPGDPIMLTFRRSIADFPLATDTQGVLQGVMSLTFVEANLRTALHIGIENPFYYKESALDTTNLLQRDRQIILARVGREFAQQLAGLDLSGGHCSGAAKEIRPVCDNQFFADFATNQAA